MLKFINVLVIALMVMSACNNLWADVLDYKGNAITEEEIKDETEYSLIVGEALRFGCCTFPLYGIPGGLYGIYYGEREREAAIRRINSYRLLQELKSRSASETEMQAAIDEAIDANMRAGWRMTLVYLGALVGSGVGMLIYWEDWCVVFFYQEEYDPQVGGYVDRDELSARATVALLLGAAIGGVGGYYRGIHMDRKAAVRKVDIKLFQLGIQRHGAFLDEPFPNKSGVRYPNHPGTDYILRLVTVKF